MSAASRAGPGYDAPLSLLRWHGKCYYLLFVWLA